MSPPGTRDDAATLLCKTILEDEPKPENLATQILRKIAGEKLKESQIFAATRLAIEWHLLLSEHVGPSDLMKLVDSRGQSPSFRAQLQKLRNNELRFHDVLLRPDPSTFFARARERRSRWRSYFEQLASLVDGTDAVHLATSCRIRVAGFIAPQSLVRGLLDRFGHDWHPTIAAHHGSADTPSNVLGRLQAAQWNTWLVRGTSVPLCTCHEWRDLCSFQFGHGDETTSIPLIAEADGDPIPFDALRPFDGSRTGVPMKLTGRLRWGPTLLRLGASPNEVERDESSDDMRPNTRRFPAARAQRSSYDDEHASPWNGELMFQAHEGEQRPAEEEGTYFLAHQWMMFLVARPGRVPPLIRRLTGRFPDLNPKPVDRRGARLWRELLPVFALANIADDVALRMQKRAVADAAVGLLRQLWDQRGDVLPEAPDELSFHLVSASDFSGCGYRLRVPPADSLLEALSERLAAEQDRAFVGAVHVPRLDVKASARSDQIVRFHAACRIPELITDYYAHLAEARRG